MRQIKYSDVESFPRYANLSRTLKENYFGSSPAPFIGRYGYPNVNVGLLTPQEIADDAWLHDAPRYWAINNFGINSIADLRLSLVNSHQKADIKSKSKIAELAQEIALATKPVDIEIELKKKPSIEMMKDNIVTPMGPSGEIKKARITENPKMQKHAEKVFYDSDLKASEGIDYLYQHKIDENTITRVLSAGAMGKNRKLVPTRWSITTVDDTLGKKLIEKVKKHNPAEFSAHFGGYLGNYFLVMFFSEIWSYELFELYTVGELQYSTDYENYNGRSNYAENCAGGYYASRLPVLEKLVEIKGQASVLVLRFITNEYTMPLGVWVVREASRKALNSTPIRFASKELLLKYAELFIRKKFNIDLKEIFGRSRLLNNAKSQSKLSNW